MAGVPRRLGLILRLIPLVLAAALWAWSFRHADERGNGRRAVLSELGVVYVLVGDVDDGYSGTPAKSNGVLEQETGTVRRRWLTVWGWSSRGDRFAAVQWWAVAAACGGGPLDRAKATGARGARV